LTQEKKYAQGSRLNPHIFVSFFNEIATERKTMLVASISFFNELATERKTMLVALLDHGFQEDNALEGDLMGEEGENST
jgi:hypothetical protein